MNIHYFLMRLCRFKPIGLNPVPAKKCVIIMAPHTAVADFFLGMMMIRYLKLKQVVVMKKATKLSQTTRTRRKRPSALIWISVL